MCRREAGDWRGALADLDSALEFEPSNTWALVERAALRQGVQTLVQCQVLNGLRPDAHLHSSFAKSHECSGCHGMCRRDIGDYGRALEDLNHAIEIQPDFTRALAERGAAL